MPDHHRRRRRLAVRVDGSKQLADTEVDHLDAIRSVLLAGQKQVGELQVAVDDAHRVGLRERVASLKQVVASARQRQRPDLFQVALQVHSVQALHHEVGHAPVEHAHVEHPNRVGALEPRRHPRLTDEALEVLPLPQVPRVQNLDRDLGPFVGQAIGGQEPGRVDRSHRALGERLGDAVGVGDHVAGAEDGLLHGSFDVSSRAANVRDVRTPRGSRSGTRGSSRCSCGSGRGRRPTPRCRRRRPSPRCP